MRTLTNSGHTYSALTPLNGGGGLRPICRQQNLQYLNFFVIKTRDCKKERKIQRKRERYRLKEKEWQILGMKNCCHITIKKGFNSLLTR